MFTLNCKGRLLVIDTPVVMGIINTTPDSFYVASRKVVKEDILALAEKMLQEGATILDIGGQSTRPGSDLLTAEEELERVVPVIEAIRKKFENCFISVDTFYSKVAQQSVAAGADMINDISAGSMDPDMVRVVAGLDVPYVLMHMRGTPQTMQQMTSYENVTREVLDYCISKKDELHKAGIKDIIIDPGFGFAKTIEQNFELLKNLPVFEMLHAPVLCGLSRKSTIYKTLGITADEALNGTTVLNSIALLNGASILRVHDVKEAREAIILLNAYKK